MRKFRTNYWTCGKFADMIRGEKKPFALEWGRWEVWREKQKKERPWRYWMSDTALSKLQNFLYYPSDLWYGVRCYIRNRYITQTHVLKTGLKKGEWYDLDTRILYSLFNELVEFVEIELAHLSKSDRNKKYKFKNGRCIEAAYDYFKWANDLRYDEDHGVYPTDELYGELTDQAIKSQKIKELYEWWITERPNRDDPLITITKETYGKQYYKLIDSIEKDYEKEDTAKLVELIKIRDSLWT